MRGLKFFVAFFVAVSGTPYYTRSLVETPTSRVEQRLLLSPQHNIPYTIQPQHVQSFSNFEFPKQQVVYYYPEPSHVQQPLNLYNLRQDTPWWQGVWNQLVGQGSEGGEGGEGSTDSGEDSSEDLKKSTVQEYSVTTEMPQLSREETNKISPKEDTESISVEAAAQPEKLETLPAGDEQTYQAQQQLNHQQYQAQQQTPIQQNNQDYEAQQHPQQQQSQREYQAQQQPLEVESYQHELPQYQPIENNPPRHQPVPQYHQPQENHQTAQQETLQEPQQLVEQVHQQQYHQQQIHQQQYNQQHHQERYQIPMHHQQFQPPIHQLYTHNQQFYVVSGAPDFFGNFDGFNNARSPIFSLQKLEPIMRNEENSNAKIKKIAPIPMPSTEPTSTLRINVVDEDEAEKSEDDKKPEQVSARSQLPSDDRNSEQQKMSREEEKQKPAKAEGLHVLLSVIANH